MKTIHIHHIYKQYITKLTKLNTHKKILSYKQYIKSILTNTPLNNIKNIIKNTTNHTFTQKKIIKLYYNTYLNKINKHNYPQYIPPIFKLHNIKNKLKKKTIYSIKKSLNSKIYTKLIKHITFKIQINTIQNIINITIKIFLTPFLLIILFPLSIITTITPTLIPHLPIQNINSQSFNKNITKKIYKNLSNNKYNIIKKISSHLQQSFNTTNKHLKTITKNLKNFNKQINLIK